MRGPDGDVARYRQIVLPVLTFVIMPVADLSAAITVADLGIPEPIMCHAGRVSTDDGLEEQLLSLAQVTQVTLPGSWMRAICDVAWRWLVLELRPVGF